MQLYFDLDLAAFVSGPGTRDLLAGLTVKRGDSLSVVIQFVRGAVAQELASGAEGVLGIKSAGDYDGDFIASATSWTKSGTGTATLYTFTVSLNTTAITTLLAGDTASIFASLELEYLVGTVRTSSQTVAVTIHNDVIKGTEAGPVEITGGIPVPDAFMVVTGTLNDGHSAITVPTLSYIGVYGGKNQYGSGSYLLRWAGGTAWTLSNPLGGLWTSSSAVATPDLASGWAAGGDSTGTPVVTAIPTPGVLCAMKVSPGFLYVVDEIDGDGQPVWKKAALSAL
jgi:hypothetical protein